MPNRTSRRHVAGRSDLPAIAVLCLGLLFAGQLAPAQRPAASAHSARGGAASSAAMPAQSVTTAPQGSAGITSRTAAIAGHGSSGFDRPVSASRSQPHMGLRLGLGGRWWDDHETVRKLNLTSDQQHRMDNIFEANRPTLATLYTNLQREEANLASISRSDLHDETRVFAAIDRVSHARNDLEKENVHILLQIRQQLAPQQLETLDRAIATAQ
jgi:Spy/CpxP family protein refolding chaperone